MHSVFHFKQFDVSHGQSAQKVTTDSVLLGSWFEVGRASGRVLDVGTGSGLLALMVAQRWENALVTAIELDNESAEECRLNFANSPWASRLKLVEGDFVDWSTEQRFDLIISNPPYFNEDTLSNSQQRNVARHETSLNVDSLLRKGSSLLASGGSIVVVCPWKERSRLLSDSEILGFGKIRECKVITVEGREPALGLFQIWAKGDGRSSETITIRDTSNNYTQEYKELTNDFYKFLH